MRRLCAMSITALLGAFLSSGCGDKPEAPAPEIETSQVVIDMGAVTSSIVIEKSTDVDNHIVIHGAQCSDNLRDGVNG